MTNDKIVNHIKAQLITDSGVILGIPIEYHEGMFKLMELAAQMAREDEAKKILEIIEKEKV